MLNRSLSSRSKLVTPFEAWTGKKPELSHAKVFRCEAYVHIPDQHRKKRDTKSRKLIFVGYQGDSRNYRLIDPETNKIIISRDVVFNEYTKTEFTCSAVCFFKIKRTRQATMNRLLTQTISPKVKPSARMHNVRPNQMSICDPD